jgi:hypothetical protein
VVVLQVVIITRTGNRWAGGPDSLGSLDPELGKDWDVTTQERQHSPEACTHARDGSGDSLRGEMRVRETDRLIKIRVVDVAKHARDLQ